MLPQRHSRGIPASRNHHQMGDSFPSPDSQVPCRHPLALTDCCDTGGSASLCAPAIRRCCMGRVGNQGGHDPDSGRSNISCGSDPADTARPGSPAHRSGEAPASTAATDAGAAASMAEEAAADPAQSLDHLPDVGYPIWGNQPSCAQRTSTTDRPSMDTTERDDRGCRRWCMAARLQSQ